MEENKKVAGGGFLTTAQFASKWWADRLDGTVKDIRLEKQFMERAELEKITHPEHVEEVDDIIETFKNEKEEYLSTLLLFPAERRKFEEELTKFIEQQLEKRGVSILCVDEDGAQFELAWAAENAEIEFCADSVFTFAPYVEMIVSKDKVEARFDKNDPFETVFDVEIARVESRQLKEENFSKKEKEIEKENRI